MEQLWSPWRSQYLQRGAEAHEACFLCTAASAQEPSIDMLVVARFASTMVVMNRYPYNAGHLLVAPVDHLGDLALLDRSIANELMETTQTALRVVHRVLSPHGCNVGINLGVDAGAGVPDHLHVHIVPRWRGDTNFMPVLADVRMVGTRLEELWHSYVEAFRLVAEQS
ncbi:MAG: HIT domain-containing protein [Candidatus Kapabacteria bacterium]|nr:HIT domain-containing protein [Candidatus Kapabacteria bacterium]